jgi:hypothetical protein
MTSSTVNPHASDSGGTFWAPAQQLYQEYKAELCHGLRNRGDSIFPSGSLFVTTQLRSKNMNSHLSLTKHASGSGGKLRIPFPLGES